MDKEVPEIQNGDKESDTEEKSMEELEAEYACLSNKLEECQVKFKQLHQKRRVALKQEMLLKEEALNLSNMVGAEERKLDEMRRRTEAYVEDFVQKINCTLEKNKHVFDINGEDDEKRHWKRVFDERRKYFKLKGKMEALLLYKEYQECVIDEIHRMEDHTSVEE